MSTDRGEAAGRACRRPFAAATAALPAVHVQNSSLEIAWKRVATEDGTIAGRRVAPFSTDGLEGSSIDYPDDFERAEACAHSLPAVPVTPFRVASRAVRRRYAAAVNAIELLAESKIRAAMAAGEFDDLPGRGKPLPLDDLARVPADLRMGFKLLRNAGCLPPELEARKEAARLGALMAATGSKDERAHLCSLRADAELRYRVLIERRSR